MAGVENEGENAADDDELSEDGSVDIEGESEDELEEEEEGEGEAEAEAEADGDAMEVDGTEKPAASTAKPVSVAS
jgi:histone chaperone ASF1